MKFCLRCNQPILNSKVHYGQHLECFETVFHCDGAAEFQSLTRKKSTSFNSGNENQASPHLTSYFGGAYRKYEGKLKNHSYLIKLSKDDYPELAPVEYVCNKIAYDLKINIPTPFTLLDFGKGELAFVSRNFMEDQTQHATLNHLYHYLPRGEESYNVEEIAKAIYRETKSVEDYRQFFRVLLFDALIGNHDRHGRNFAFVETASGKRLAPIYDNPSALGQESGSVLKMQHEPRGKIWTYESKEPIMGDYLKEMHRLKVFSLAKEVFKTLDIQKILSRISESHCLTQEMQNALKSLITKRYQAYEKFITS